jgi:cytochrome c oxidase cbb3-type subunit 4
MKMDVNLMRVAVTVVSFLSFIGIWWWAWRSSNRSRFDELARVCVGLEEPCHGASALRSAVLISQVVQTETGLPFSKKESA